MGRDVCIDYHFTERLSVPGVLERLARAGWRAAFGASDGRITFMVGDFEWMAHADYAYAVDRMSVSLSAGETVAIQLGLPDGSGVNVLMPDTRTMLSVAPGANRRTLTGAPVVTDLAWYFTRTAPYLADLGLIAVTTTDAYP